MPMDKKIPKSTPKMTVMAKVNKKRNKSFQALIFHINSTSSNSKRPVAATKIMEDMTTLGKNENKGPNKKMVSKMTKLVIKVNN